MLIISRDALRQSVEAASGGLCTVIYSRKGQPLFLRAVPKFRVETLHPNLGSGVHPAFIVGNREVSEIWVGMYPGFVSNGEILSVPGRPPSTLSYNAAIEMARATGPGVHHLTAAEWAAVALYSIHSVGGGVDPVYGPDPYGQSLGNPAQFGRRVDGKAPGDTSSMSFCLGGSGPLNWRHDLSPWGIADLVVGISPGTLVTGLALRNGEINIIPNNDAALANTDLSPSSPAWQAIMPNGTLVNPGTTGTLKFDIPPSANYSGNNQNLGVPYLRTQRITPPFNEDADTDYAAGAFVSLARDPTNLQVPNLLYQLLLFPHITVTQNELRGRVLVRPYGFRVPGRGWEGLAGLFLNTLGSFHRPTRIAYVPL